MRYARLAILIASLGVFAHWFDPGRPQWLVDGLWLMAVCLWVIEIKDRGGQPLVGLRVPFGQVAPLLVAAAVLAAAWLPFYDNWRWAYTGDSISWYEIGRAPAVQHHLPQSILSVNGVDGNFTYLHGIGFNSLMFIFEPTLFWHRVGKLIVSCLSLGAIYTFFTLTVGRWWGLAVVAGTATNYVWLWFSYVSYGHIDSYIFYFLSLTFALLVFRQPERLGLWMLCGLIGGLSLFFTQTAWSAVLVVGMVLSVFALRTGRWRALVVYGLSYLLVALPILLQFSGLLTMTTRQARSIYEWPYLVRIFTEIVRLPYQWGYFHIGVQGAFLRWPLGPLYVLGGLLSVLAVVPPLRRALRLPAVAPVVAGLLLWDAVLMTLTNNGYGSPSTKRIYALIPLHVFLALLPLYVVHAWCARWNWLRAAMVGVVAVVLGAYAVANYRLIASPMKGVYGVNIFDGLIELRQRFPERRVAVFSSREFLTDLLLSAQSFFNVTYHVGDRLSLERSFTPDALRSACAAGAVICYEPNFDAENFDRMTGPGKGGIRPFELLNTQEMVCFECATEPLTRGRTSRTRAAG